MALVERHPEIVFLDKVPVPAPASAPRRLFWLLPTSRRFEYRLCQVCLFLLSVLAAAAALSTLWMILVLASEPFFGCFSSSRVIGGERFLLSAFLTLLVSIFGISTATQALREFAGTEGRPGRTGSHVSDAAPNRRRRTASTPLEQ